MRYLQKNKKRFSENQINSLEIKFRADSRPESKAKQKLAVELGLQPRQVAVWFQNRRARSRTKQIERDYYALKADCDNLASKIESLERENQALYNQLTLLENQQETDNLDLEKSENGELKNLIRNHRFGDSAKNVEMEVEILDLARNESSYSQLWEFWLDNNALDQQLQDSAAMC